MSKPKRPQNYSTVFFDLGRHMQVSTREVILTFKTEREAIDFRTTFHCFRRALMEEAKRKDIEAAAAKEMSNMALAMGSFTTKLDTDFTQVNVKLRFFYRDLSPQYMDIAAQLKSQLAEAPSQPTTLRPAFEDEAAPREGSALMEKVLDKYLGREEES